MTFLLPILTVLLMVLAPVVGIATAGREKHLLRANYAVLVGGLLLVNFILSAIVDVGDIADATGPAAAVAVAVLMLAVVAITTFFGARWSGHRLNHLGWSRWWALLLIVPIINVLTIIGFCVVPGQQRASDTGTGN